MIRVLPGPADDRAGPRPPRPRRARRAAGGAADAHALRLGNRLLGNDEGAAGLEATLAGPALLFERRAVVALAGAPFSSTLDGVEVLPWSVLEVPAGGRLDVGRALSGARAYVCVRGRDRRRPPSSGAGRRTWRRASAGARGGP